MRPGDTLLATKNEIRRALEQGAPVYADCLDLPDRLPVRDVMMRRGLLSIRVLEGWRAPVAVYISQPGLSNTQGER